MRSFIALAVLLIAGSARAEPIAFDAGTRWQGLGLTVPGATTPLWCGVMPSATSEPALVLVRNAHGRLLLLHELHWSYPPDVTTLWVDIGIDGAWRSVFATPQPEGIALPMDEYLDTALRKGKTLEIAFNAGSFHFSLEGSARALARMDACLHAEIPDSAPERTASLSGTLAALPRGAIAETSPPQTRLLMQGRIFETDRSPLGHLAG